jgi:tetratricopeptide (TPR) repeat protein
MLSGGAGEALQIRTIDFEVVMTRSLFPRVVLSLCLFLPPIVRAQSADADRGAQLFRAKQYAEAKTVLTPPARSGDAWASYWLGRVAMAENKLDAAEDHFERAIKANGTISEFHLWLGRAAGEKAQNANVLKQPGLARKTKSAWERAIALDPKNLDARADLVSYYIMAPGIMGGSHEKAREQVEEIRKLNPYRGGLEAVRVAENEKKPARAEGELRILVSSFPDSAAPLVRLGLVLQGQQKWADAFSLFDEVLARKPNDPSALYQLGRTAAMSGQRLDDGQAALEKFLALQQPPPGLSLGGAHFRLGMIAERRGDIPVARKEYETAVSLEPRLEDAKKALARVNKK